ncbi:MAG: alpha/beta hydrolase [Microthrixaceae bacterium]
MSDSTIDRPPGVQSAPPGGSDSAGPATGDLGWRLERATPASPSAPTQPGAGRSSQAVTVVPLSSPRRLRTFQRLAPRVASPRDDTDPWEIRRTIDRMARWAPPTPGVRATTSSVAGVPGEWLVPRVRSDERLLLYLHGGGYIAGSPRTHRSLVGSLASSMGAAAFVPQYRLAPEHPFPAALDDVRAVYDELVRRGYGDRLVVAGDSAGGGLATALMVDRRDAGGAMPQRLALLSPWVDLTGPIPEAVLDREATDVVMAPHQIRAAARAYAGDQLDHPAVSPLRADLAGLPPTLIQVGSAELLGLEGELLSDKLRAAGVEAALEIWNSMAHVFQAVPVLKERRPAIARLAGHLSSSSPGSA